MITLEIRLTTSALTVLCTFDRVANVFSLWVTFPTEISEIQTLNPNGKKYLPFGTFLAVKEETRDRFHSDVFSHDFLGLG